jgi:selenocysteine lyase/cysteine desulfurase
LRERRIFVDHRPGCGLRVSAHAYTTDEEIERFVTAMDALVKL